MIGRAGGTIDGRQADYGFVHAWTLRDGVCVRFAAGGIQQSPVLVNVDGEGRAIISSRETA